MSYRLNAITIHVNSAKEYKGEMKEIWRDITNGKLPILFDRNMILVILTETWNYAHKKHGSK